MKLHYQAVLILLVIFLAVALPAFAADHQNTGGDLQLTGTVRYLSLEGGFWGIAGDDGKNYQPTKLPGQFRKDGLAIKFTAKVRNDNFMSNLMWGTIIDLKSTATISTSLSPEERSAIYIFSRRMAAFNNKSLQQLQQVDQTAQGLTEKQMLDWIGSYGNFTLKYINVTYAGADTIQGTCFYTRELINGMSLNGNITLAGIDFTLQRGHNGWLIKDIRTLKPSETAEYFPSMDALQQAATTKYGTVTPAAILNGK